MDDLKMPEFAMKSMLLPLLPFRVVTRRVTTPKRRVTGAKGNRFSGPSGGVLPFSTTKGNAKGIAKSASNTNPVAYVTLVTLYIYKKIKIGGKARVGTSYAREGNTTPIWSGLLAGALILTACWTFPAEAAPPDNPDPALHAWFERQHSVSGAWCCDVSDGHFIDDSDVRAAGDHYEVFIEGAWQAVPNDAMRDPNYGGPNETGRPIVWYLVTPDGGIRIYCFAPGTED